jgi:hypothetical protein
MSVMRPPMSTQTIVQGAAHREFRFVPRKAPATPAR